MSPESFVLSVNGLPIRKFGKAASPFTWSLVGPTASQMYGKNGDHINIHKIIKPVNATLSVMLGTKDSAFLFQLYQFNQNITLAYSITDSLETLVFTNGVINMAAGTARGGDDEGGWSDDVYDFTFADFNGVLGGTN